MEGGSPKARLLQSVAVDPADNCIAKESIDNDVKTGGCNAQHCLL